ncbi:MAG: sugar transferase [Bacteroidia bacterium]|nr:MAG: sugar transferase [Bacteroidia bacterium]
MREVVDELIFAIPLHMIRDVEKYISMAENVGVAVRILPQWHIRQLGYTPNIGSLHFETFLGIPTMAITSTPNDDGSLLIKSFFDYLFAIVAMVICLPIFVVVAIAIKLCSKGPVFFKQERLGLNGRRFLLYKFRTMLKDADSKLGDLLNSSDELRKQFNENFKLKDDPRVTRVGKILRKTSLDELPQIFNVLMGQMNLIGPRPIVREEVEKYGEAFYELIRVKPGISGLWQISGRNDVEYDRRVQLDLFYIKNWSLWMDIMILLRTLIVVIQGRGRGELWALFFSVAFLQ